jgi:hypothetical protein
VVGAEAGRSCSSVTAAKPSGRRSSEGVDGVPVARVLEGVKKLLGSFYGSMWCCLCSWLG